MESSTITGKGQTTIPTKIRRLLKVSTGDKVQYHVDEKGNVCLKAATGSVKDLRRIVRPARQRLTDEEMRRGMEKGVADHVLGHDRD